MWTMNSLEDASFEELHALLKCLDHYDKSGRDDGAHWRELVFAEMRRRFAELKERTRVTDATRADRSAPGSA
jgi:hypothetical protein